MFAPINTPDGTVFEKIVQNCSHHLNAYAAFDQAGNATGKLLF